MSADTSPAKRPASQFYWDEYFGDKRLRLCSSAARGLWMDMLCIMHQGEPYGHLTFEGQVVDDRQLARLVGEPMKQVKRWREELATQNVYSVDDSGRIYSRRMVRDELLRNARAAGGQLGANHGVKGKSHGGKGGRPPVDNNPPHIPPSTGVKEPPSMVDKEPPLKPPPSSSSSLPTTEGSDNSSTSRAHVKPLPPGWWTSEENIVKAGRSLGLEPRSGESAATFRSRVEDASEGRTTKPQSTTSPSVEKTARIAEEQRTWTETAAPPPPDLMAQYTRRPHASQGDHDDGLETLDT